MTTQDLVPVNQQFNDASNFIASQIFPLSFEVRHSAPNTMLELGVCLGVLNRMAIWDGDYTHTCFGHSETWLQFRAWHDWCHHRFDCAFTLEGEHKACHIQAGQLMRLYGRGEDVRDMIALLFCEILSKLEYIVETGEYVKDGYAFTCAKWPEWVAYADNIIAHQGLTDVDAMAFAEKAYDYRAEFGPTVPKDKNDGVS